MRRLQHTAALLAIAPLALLALARPQASPPQPAPVGRNASLGHGSLAPLPEALRVYSNGSHTYPSTSADAGSGITVRTLSLGIGRGGGAPMQTHEVAFCAKRARAYVSLLTTGQLFEFRFDSEGRLDSTVDRFTLNSPGSGAHNIASSVCHPGMLWVSTQYVQPQPCRHAHGMHHGQHPLLTFAAQSSQHPLLTFAAQISG